MKKLLTLVAVVGCYVLAISSCCFGLVQVSYLLLHEVRPVQNPISALAGASFLASYTFCWLSNQIAFIDQ